jgi:hypothetical protein
MLLGARSASAAVSLDCFNFQANNATIGVPATGTVDVIVSGNGGAWVEIVPFNPTDHFSAQLLDTSGNVLDTNDGANGTYSRTYLRSGSGTVRVSSTNGVAFTAIAACKNAFPRHN